MFRRRSATDRDSGAGSADDPTASAATNGARRATSKGRPTPTRKEAEQARKQRVRPALTRREAARRDRQQSRTERGRARQAMISGDERYLPQRDKGPVRKFVRDYVDSRRTFAEFFLPAILLVLLLSLIRSPQVQLFSTLLWMATIVLVIVDVAMLAFRVKRQIRQRFPDEDGRGHTFYAIARASQIRRLRLPKPTVRPGTPV